MIVRCSSCRSELEVPSTGQFMCYQCKSIVNVVEFAKPTTDFLVSKVRKSRRQKKDEMYNLAKSAAVLVVFAGGLLYYALQPKTERVKLDPRERMIQNQFSQWDGSHVQLVKTVKATLHDPKSFEHVSTKYWDRGDDIKITMVCRAKNGFGALRTTTYVATADLNGNLTDVENAE